MKPRPRPSQPRPVASKQALTSEQQWLADLAGLLRDAKELFADVTWLADDGSLVYAHKGVVFARASGSFHQRYLVPSFIASSHGDSSLSLPFHPAQRSVTPSAGARDYVDQPQFLRSASPTSLISVASASPSAPIALTGTDVAIFRSLLEHFYSATNTAESFTVLFEGFEEGVRDGETELKGVDKLRADLLYSWRSKLYADMSLSLGDVNSSSIFTTHRAILAARSPYFRSLLLGNYSDSNKTHFTLPSPPFTASSTTFILGYCYAGTLDFGNRTFDLTTAFEIWRGAAYLQLSLLQVEIEAKIEHMLTVARAARVYNFALAPDVNSQRLARSAHPFVVSQFQDTWNCPQIGLLDYDSQRKLVSAVCDTVTPEALTTVAKGSFSLRKRLELERASWATHVRAMLDAIDDRLKAQLGKSLPQVVVSPAFVALVDGQGFSTDVLEWLVSDLVVGSLTEAKAPETYQALVGSVLLREAKVLIEDARNGILKYIKRRWMGIVSAKGFDRLESWCLKELSDELEVPVEDLLTPRPKSSSSRLTAARAATTKKTTPTHDSTSATTAMVPRQSGTATHATSPVVSSAATTAAAPVTSAQRTQRVSTVSAASSTSRSAAPPSQTALGRATAQAARGARLVVRSGATPVRAIARSDASASGLPTAEDLDAAKDESSAPPSLRSVLSPPDTTLLKPSRVSLAIPHASTSSPTSKETTRSATSNGTKTRPNPSITRRPPSLAPSVLRSERSVTAPSVKLAPRSPTAAASSSRPSGPLPRTPTAASPAVVLNAKPATEKPLPEAATPKVATRPSSVALGKASADSSSKRPASAASTRSIPSSIRRPPSAGSLKVVTPKASARSLPGKTSTTPKVTSKAPPLPSSSASDDLPGTALLSGIPCIVTVASDRPTRFRASVRYIGGVLWAEGQWIGIEVAESAIPDEARDLPWNQGDVDGRRYFDIKGAESSQSSSSGRITPLVGEVADGRSAGSSASSLRPPSRRGRRSSSSDAFESGPRKGLFVRPDQIVYVL